MTDSYTEHRPANIEVFTDLMAIIDGSNERFEGINAHVMAQAGDEALLGNLYTAEVYNRFTSSMTQHYPIMKSIEVIYNIDGCDSSLSLNGKVINKEDDFWEILKDWQEMEAREIQAERLRWQAERG